MIIKNFREYLLKNLADFGDELSVLVARVVDWIDDNETDELQKDAIEAIVKSLNAILILKFERKTEEKLIVALKKIITIL